MPNIRISGHTKDQLDRVKEAEEHTSYDSVIRALAGAYEIAEAQDA